MEDEGLEQAVVIATKNDLFNQHRVVQVLPLRGITAWSGLLVFIITFLPSDHDGSPA